MILLSLLISKDALAIEPDFYLSFKSCKSVAALTVAMEDAIKVIDSDIPFYSCARNNDLITCHIAFESGEKNIKGDVIEYKVSLDIPPFLHFQTENGSDYLAINVTDGGVVSSSRLVGEEYFGAKICHGIFATKYFVEQLNKQKK